MNPTARSWEDAPTIAMDMEHRQFVTMRVGPQMFGIPVLQVQDVLRGQKIARIPLAPKEIAGSMNLRGRIVTVIDVRQRLGLPPIEDGKAKRMSVVVEYKDELFSLMVDTVGEVMSLAKNRFEPNPPNLTARWKEVAEGIYRLREELLVVLDVKRLLAFAN